MDLSQVEWIAPIGIVGLLALVHRANNAGVDVELLAPESPEVRNFLDYAGFLAALEATGGIVDPAVRRAPDASPIRPCLEVRHVTTEWDMEQAANKLEEILSTLAAPPQARNAVYLVMTELTNNAWQHGKGCYAMAQTHTGARSRRPGIELAIADLGPGFAATLAAHQPKSEVEAMLLAFDDRITGTADPGRGFGLGYVRDYIDAYPGPASLSIVSKDGWVNRAGQQFDCFEGPNCQGVYVTGYFPFDTLHS